MGDVVKFQEDHSVKFGLTGYLAEVIEARLKRCLELAPLSEPLSSAIEYSIFPAGKRIRPLLSCLLYHDLGGDAERLAAAAVSIELVHCASLIHDDLPAFDDDDFRRGRPSCHKAYGEATAILGGDVLVPHAIACLWDTDFTDSQKLHFMRILSSAYVVVCNGQQLDILPEGERGSLDEIHRQKTAALFAAATEYVGIAMGADDNLQQRLQKLGNSIGLYFQMINDFIDVHGSGKDRGRSGSSDEKNERGNLFRSQDREAALEEVRAVRADIEKNLNLIRSATGDQKCRFKGTKAVLDKVTLPLNS